MIETSKFDCRLVSEVQGIECFTDQRLERSCAGLDFDSFGTIMCSRYLDNYLETRLGLFPHLAKALGKAVGVTLEGLNEGIKHLNGCTVDSVDDLKKLPDIRIVERGGAVFVFPTPSIFYMFRVREER